MPLQNYLNKYSFKILLQGQVKTKNFKILLR